MTLFWEKLVGTSLTRLYALPGWYLGLIKSPQYFQFRIYQRGIFFFRNENLNLFRYVIVGSSTPFLKLGVSELTGWESQEYLQYASWVPGKLAGLVQEHDIYYKPQSTLHRKLTRWLLKGKVGVVFIKVNYEQQVFNGFWFNLQICKSSKFENIGLVIN